MITMNESLNTVILIVHPESKDQALLCPIDVLRSSCKCNGGQVEERWSVPFMNGISGNEVWLEMEVTIGMIRSSMPIWMNLEKWNASKTFSLAITFHQTKEEVKEKYSALLKMVH